MIRKHEAGAAWFVSQAVYDPAPTIRLLNDYGDECRARGLKPRKVVLTFAPCGRAKTMTFLKWLGIKVPEASEKRILEAESPVDESVALLCETLESILDQTKSCGVPLGAPRRRRVKPRGVDASNPAAARLRDGRKYQIHGAAPGPSAAGA